MLVRPNDQVTRQELATMIYRFAQAQGVDMTADSSALADKTDAASIADWALEAVTYCTAEKYLAGSNGAFSPKGTATRAMGAKVLMNMTKEAA